MKIRKFLREKDVKSATVRYLSRIGYNKYLKVKELREHGVDIKVRHYQYPVYFLVEVKGDPNPDRYKSPSSGKEEHFNYILGQIISRMKYKAHYKYGVGLPESYSDKVFRRLPWLACQKLNLSVFLVDNTLKAKRYTWKELKKIQKL